MTANRKRTGGVATASMEWTAAHNASVRLRSDQTVALIRKLRWIGEEAEAQRLELTLRASTRFDMKDPVLYETD